MTTHDASFWTAAGPRGYPRWSTPTDTGVTAVDRAVSHYRRMLDRLDAKSREHQALDDPKTHNAAEAADKTALAEWQALDDAKREKAPRPGTPAQDDLRMRQRETARDLDALKQAVSTAAGELVVAIDEHRGELDRKASVTAKRAEGRFLSAVDELEAAAVARAEALRLADWLDDPAGVRGWGRPMRVADVHLGPAGTSAELAAALRAIVAPPPPPPEPAVPSPLPMVGGQSFTTSTAA